MHSTVRNGTPTMLGRALTLLSAFRPGEPELGLAELARRTGIAKPTAHRLLGELERWAMVERVGRAYRLGLRLFELGQLVPQQRDLQETASPFLADLFEATHETVHLAVPDGAEVVYVHKLSAAGAPEIPSRLGGRMPAHCTAVGKALLAFGPPERLTAVLEAGLTRRTPRTVILPGLLGRELEEVRRSGIAEEHEESAPGVACVAAPVLGPTGTAVAAVSIAGWVNRLRPARVTAAVSTTARALTRTLGGPLLGARR
ncbi:IclR family transcriptional regulator [Pseudonocardia kujensis]|uniref:IclR family transcriptional regulator n=1 Tax=Pseudonocardia kujensis TaxID=1128675 RepID=UPI001E33F518|nr:IclR family transcriptional regulator [Pseudonocardia kujensis]MCE0764200.1 IclR family transcriptional regulator [Pseudonocardia kujensis]